MTIQPINDCSQTACCHAHPKIVDKSSTMEKVLHIAEKVSLVAIGILAAVIALPWFLASFAVGTIIGLVSENTQQEHSDRPRDHSVCSHGFLEHLTGVRLPAGLGLAANVAIMAAHIDHHASVFVPIVGVTLGIWAGRQAAPTVSLCFRKVAEVVLQPCVPDFSGLVLLP